MTDNDPLISVIVPIYNVEQYLDQCVRSIINQTYHNLEIILVNDGSPDRCPEICDKWSAYDKRIIAVHQKNRGLAGARESGVQMSHGEYVLFVDADDWILPSLVEDAVSAVTKFDADAVFYGYQRISDREAMQNMQPTAIHFPVVGCASGNKALQTLFEGKLHWNVWQIMSRRSILLRVTFPIGIMMGEDLVATCQILGEARSVAFIPKANYCYRMREDSSVSESTKSVDKILAMVDDLTLAQCQVLDYVERKHPMLKSYCLHTFYCLQYSNICFLSVCKIIPKHMKQKQIELERDALKTYIQLDTHDFKDIIRAILIYTHLVRIRWIANLLVRYTV